MANDLIAEVALRAALGPGSSPVYTYRVPERLRAQLQPGQLVWVPLQRRQVQGVVLEIGEAEAGAGRALREIVDLGDPAASIPPAGLRLAAWVADTYRSTRYEALALLLPPGVGQDSETTWQATAAGLAAELGALPPGEREVLYYLRSRGTLGERDLRKALRGSDADLRAIYTALRERGLVADGAALSAPRARPRTERLARLTIAPADLDAALAELERAPKQLAVVQWMLEQAADSRQQAAGLPLELPATASRAPETADLPPLPSEGPAPGASGFSPLPPLDSPANSGDPIPVSTIYAATGASSTLLRQLESRGLLELSAREVRRDPLAGDGVPPDSPPPLTPEQRTAYEQIVAALEGQRDRGTGGQGDRGTGGQGDSDPQRRRSLSPSERSELSPLSASAASGPRPSSASAASTPAVFLLHGVTGSGKTEVYLRTIARALRLGRQALVLVPEIALTAQLVRRFAARFPGKLAVLHSGLSLGERYDEWRRLRSGAARLAIGSRSVVFAPLPELGLIVVDEEHELTYKHDAGPRYHARDAAIKLAELTGSVVILGSATPSVESFAAARAGRYRLIELQERVGGAIGPDGMPRSAPLPLPPVRLIDMRRELQSGNRSIFSRPLQQALDEVIERREQAILFLNRRGAASFVMCRDCGHVVSCPACSGPLTVHYDELDENQGLGAGGQGLGAGRQGQTEAQPPHPGPPVQTHDIASLPTPTFRLTSSYLICHSCGYSSLVPTICANCLSPRVKEFGVGTQRVMEEVLRLLPQARVLRWDRDSVSGKGAHSRMLDAFLHHQADVLVGTQMIAKGLDLPLVSLVGVVAADTGLHLPDFRSGERAFQLLTQVAGRAGRRSAGAQVIIQTYNPEHYALQAAQEHDYDAFYQQEIAYRQTTGYPPFGRLVRLVFAAGSEAAGKRAAEELGRKAQTLIAERRLEGWGLIGPAPAFFQRVRGRWRWHLIIRAPIAQADTRSIGAFLDALGSLPGWIVDVDPAHVL